MNSQGGTRQTKPLTSSDPPVVSSDQLFGGHREILIQHGNERYRLMTTASNKLILIK